MAKYRAQDNTVQINRFGRWDTLFSTDAAERWAKALNDRAKPKPPAPVDTEKAAPAMPEPRLAMPDDDPDLYERVYERVLSQTEDPVKARFAAMGAMRRVVSGMAAKSAFDIEAGDVVEIEGWAVMYGDKTIRDKHGTYFAKSTEFMLDYYPAAPLFMDHGRVKGYGVAPIGVRTGYEVYDHGIWMRHELDPNHPLFQKTYDALVSGEFTYSTDALPFVTEAAFDPSSKEYGAFPLIGCSITRTPAEPGLGGLIVKVVKRD